MSDNAQTDAAELAPPRDKGPLLLAAGGLAAAFGAASCCGLPVLLGSLGLGSAWLVTVAWLAAPHRIAFLIAAVVCLAGGGGTFLWRRRVAACRTSASPGRLATAALLTAILLAGGVLVVLGYLYA